MCYQCPLSLSVHTSNIFSLEVRFYMEHICLAGTKVHMIDPDHMTKMATMLIYGNNPLKIFARTISQMILAHSKRDLDPEKVIYK